LRTAERAERIEFFEAAPEMLVMGQEASGRMQVTQKTREAPRAANTKPAGSEPRIGG